MNANPTITAVIPAFNSAAYIKDAVESIRAQTFPINEIIIVDDGSTDNTKDIIRTLGDDIHYIFQDNAGPSAARNRGIREASSELIAFLDADDQWTKTKTEQQVSIFDRHPEMVLVAGDMSEIDTQDRIIVPSVLQKHDLLFRFQELNGRPVPNALAFLMRINFIPTGTVLARRNALLEAGCFPEDIRYGEDLALWARIASRHAISCVPGVLMLRRQHGQNVTQDTLPLFRDLVNVCIRVREWGRNALVQQGVDPDQLVSSAWANLGYAYFTSGDIKHAKQAFSHSMQEKLNMRAFSYQLLSNLPLTLVSGLRKIKGALIKQVKPERNEYNKQ